MFSYIWLQGVALRILKARSDGICLVSQRPLQYKVILAMDDDENYRFDIFGFIVLSGVLSPGEVAACNEAIDQMLGGGDDLPPTAGACDSLLQLRDHPVLAG